MLRWANLEKLHQLNISAGTRAPLKGPIWMFKGGANIFIQIASSDNISALVLFRKTSNELAMLCFVLLLQPEEGL